ncbi:MULTISPECIES: DUF6973 domain-containing protein [Bradyrhizobium]|uniref:DUF6973 domain-containing protein n=3 Tax=Bradyrhizobium TaxID=374 RepID=A0A809XNA3_9BRAD|nr:MULTISPECIES: hypothetical protein [Bradyrhizobium]AWO88955.1 hypothetical protein DI395_10850 [Bradyrhizobium diazoefficiens]MBP1059325.1 hypothetical protein [Bradyrhizobium japonicum]MBR1292380.1 hypothetical protein [Bradyrhizobium ottawaense]MCD9111897.1 hypothetical protein [Bradyrhizobium japonicum]MCD9260462.1 hypothetical protein [Bradyrhizobium japonicum SEMIA 5079]
MNLQTKWWRISAAMLAFIVASAVSLGYAEAATPSYLRLVVGGVCLLGVFMFASGITGVKTALVDEFNCYSLQRVITFGWFVVLSSAFLAISFWNVALWKAGGSGVVQSFVEIDASIWALAGVVLGGLVGNGVVNSIHAATPPKDAGAHESALSPDPRRQGSMYRNIEIDDAKPADITTNSQFGVQNTVDMTAVQQLLLQAAVLVAYVVAVGRLVVATASNEPIGHLPGLPAELLALLGVSAVAQVGNAAVPKAKINGEAAAPKPTERFWTEGRERAAERLAHEKSGQESGGLPITSGVLSAPEWDLFRQNPVVGALVLLHAKTAVNEALARYKSTALEDDNGDAFRHALWNARMAADSGVGVVWAEKWATTHEDGNPGKPLATQMDLFNNGVGRKAGDGMKVDEVLKKVQDCVDTGRCRVLRAGVLVNSDGKYKL